MAILYLMCGGPGSGKSTWCRENVEEDSQVWISRDEIRYSLVSENDSQFGKETLVFNTFINQICAALADDFDVYADATNCTRTARSKLLRRIPHTLYDEVHVIWIKVDVTKALVQNELRAGTRAYTDPKALRRMFKEFTPPDFNEGFDAITIIEQGKEPVTCRRTN